jgi:hypothetical protein
MWSSTHSIVLSCEGTRILGDDRSPHSNRSHARKPDFANPIDLPDELGTVDLHITSFLGSLRIVLIGQIEGIPQQTDVRILQGLEGLVGAAFHISVDDFSSNSHSHSHSHPHPMHGEVKGREGKGEQTQKHTKRPRKRDQKVSQYIPASNHSPSDPTSPT